MSTTTFSPNNGPPASRQPKCSGVARHNVGSHKLKPGYISDDRRAYDAKIRADESENQSFLRRAFDKVFGARPGDSPLSAYGDEVGLKTTAQLKYRYVAERDAPSPPPAYTAVPSHGSPRATMCRA